MNCDELKTRLSEYVDDVLDPETRGLADEHLAECEVCRAELASLKALVHELRSMEPVEPPKDFLKQLHARIEDRSRFSRILKTLFVPMRIKIPLEFAGAVIMALLIFSLFNIQQDMYRSDEAPLSTKQEGISIKETVSQVHMDAEEKASQPAEEESAIELALVMKKEKPPQTYSLKAPQAPKKEMRAMKEAAPAVRRVEGEKEKDQTLSELTRAIAAAGGRVISVDCKEGSGLPEFVHARIPASQLGTLYGRLEEMGHLRGQPKGSGVGDQEMISVRIRLYHSE